VLLDVVYNHFGPEGNYLHRYAPDFFAPAHTPWGAAIDYRVPQVRAFAIENALHWLGRYRFDGLRLDAVHAIVQPGEPSILQTLSRAVASSPARAAAAFISCSRMTTTAQACSIRSPIRRRETTGRSGTTDYSSRLAHSADGRESRLLSGLRGCPHENLARVLSSGLPSRASVATPPGPSARRSIGTSFAARVRQFPAEP